MSEKKHHILQILPSMEGGGVEQGTIDVTEVISKNHHRASVISHGGKMVPYITKAGGKHYKMPVHSKNILVMFINIFRIWLFCHKNKVTVIHARSRAPAWSAYFTAKLYGCHFVTTFHGTYGVSNSFKKFYNNIMCKGKPIIAVSQFIASHIMEIYAPEKKEIIVVPRGYNPNKFNPSKISDDSLAKIVQQHHIPLGKTILLLPGRYTSWKGQSLVIRAIADLKKHDIYAIFLGYMQRDDKEYQKLYSLAKNLNCQEKCRFIAFQDHALPVFYKLADFVVVASTSPEAFGRVAVEAQAMEKVVLAPEHGGTLEQIIHKENGFLFDHTNVEDLKKKIEEILYLSLPERKKITHNARQNALENYQIKHMQEKNLKIYESLPFKE